MMMERTVISKDVFQSLCKGIGLGKGTKTILLCYNPRESGMEGRDVGRYV